MNIIVGEKIYRIENDLGCDFFKVLLETKDSEVKLNLFHDVFIDIYNNTLRYNKYEHNYLKQALSYFGHVKHLDIFLEKERLLNFISKYPYKFDWESLSRNENIPVEFFERHLDKVSWPWLSQNKNIPVEFFERHIDKVDWEGLSQNKNIPMEFFEQHVEKVKWDYLSRNENIPVEFFERHLDKVNWYSLSQNENIPVEFFERHINNIDNYFLQKNIINRINKI